MFDEAAHHAFQHLHAAYLAVLHGEIQGIHGVGGVHRQHQVITLGLHLGVDFQPLRTHQGQDQAEPEQRQQQPVHPGGQGRARPVGVERLLQLHQGRV